MEFEAVAKLRAQGAIPFVKSLLDGEGIRYFIAGENARRLLGALATLAGHAELRVEPDRASDAREILEGIEGVDVVGRA